MIILNEIPQKPKFIDTIKNILLYQSKGLCLNPYPLISIITVVYNDAMHIAQTIESVLSQTYPNIEYIIIDGASIDGTKEIIQGYLTSKPSHLKHSITTFISEKDNGIYDAMNKGIDLANGEWCNFMNSGDRFYKDTTIQECFSQYQNLEFAMGGGQL